MLPLPPNRESNMGDGIIGGGAGARIGRHTRYRFPRSAASMVIAAIAVALSGCSSIHHAASGALCGPAEALPGWTGFAYLVKSDAGYRRYNIGAQEPVSMSPQTAPGGESMYWVIFDGSAQAGDESTPPKFTSSLDSMIYRADRARLEVNGTAVAPAAIAVFHVGDQNAYSTPAPDRRRAVSGEPINLNQRPRPLLHLGFPVNVRASDHWVFRPGSVRIGDQDIALPGKESCIKPAWDESKNLWQM